MLRRKGHTNFFAAHEEGLVVGDNAPYSVSHSGGVQQLAMILNIIEDQGVEMRTLLLGASMALMVTAANAAEDVNTAKLHAFIL